MKTETIKTGYSLPSKKKISKTAQINVIQTTKDMEKLFKPDEIVVIVARHDRMTKIDKIRKDFQESTEADEIKKERTDIVDAIVENWEAQSEDVDRLIFIKHLKATDPTLIDELAKRVSSKEDLSNAILKSYMG